MDNNKHLQNVLENPKEIRSGVFELRQDQEGKMTLIGYALKFNNPTIIGSKENGFIEVIIPGSLDSTDMKKVPLKYNHEGSYLAMASTKNKSLTLKVDDVGLRFEAELIPTQANKDVFMMVKEELLSECSFAFTIAQGGSEWLFPEDDLPVRKITKIDRLFDIALVDIPAYENTEVSARSRESLEEALKSVEAAKNEREKLKLSMEMKIKIHMGGNQ